MTAQRVKILLVDDQRTRLLSYEAILSELGHELVQASSGAEALGLLMRDDFAMILLDVNMPVMDGFETASLIHQHPRFQNTPIIFVTAFHHTDLDRVKAYQVGAVDYVFLPVIPAILRSKVSVLVELYQKRLELQQLNESLRVANAELAEANSLLQAERTRELDRFSRTLEDANAQLTEANEGLRDEVHERQRAEEALRASEERLRAILQNTSASIYQTDLDGRFVHVNRMFEELAGRSSAEIVGRRADEIFPADVAAEMTANDRLVLARQQPLEFEESFEVHGEEHVYRSVKAPLIDEGGVLRGVVGLSTDVTERQHLVQELRQADRRKDEFLAMLAHELRNPLAPIASAAQIMRLKQIEDKEVQWCRDVIERQTELLTRLVDDLLDISRISYGKINLKKEVVDVADVIVRAIETSQPFLDQRSHRLEVTLPRETVRVHADPARLGQVVSNLLNNAAKYSDSGRTIRLTVESAETPAREGPRQVQIRVQDEGNGIAPELLPHVFDLFTQGDRSFGRTQGGLGIGLALVHKLVTMQGGTVSAHSDGAGKGSEFVVRLPVSPEPTPQPAARPAEDSQVERACRVLIVDDNVDSAVGLAMILRRRGHEVSVAHDGFAGLEQADVFRPDVALLDIGMPEMDGCDLAQRIRALSWGSRVILIAMTGWSQDEARARTLKAGFDLHIIKPVDATVLGKTIATLRATHPPLQTT